MNTRIRYVSERTDTNVSLVSLRVFRSDTSGSEFKVYLYPSEGQYQIKNAVSGDVIADGTGVSLPNLKVKAKKALSSLGVAFDSETRVKDDNSATV